MHGMFREATGTHEEIKNLKTDQNRAPDEIAIQQCGQPVSATDDTAEHGLASVFIGVHPWPPWLHLIGNFGFD